MASLRAEAVSRGLAAQKAVEAAGGHVLNDHADIAGHGWSDRDSEDTLREEAIERLELEQRSTVQLPRIDLSVAYDPPA